MRVTGVQAFLPAVTVRADGTIGVLYYDLRNDTASGATLLVDAWLVDIARWRRRGPNATSAGPFDLDLAPIAEGGLFVGDYQGLASANGAFVAFFAQTHADADNRTDIFASAFRSIGMHARGCEIVSSACASGAGDDAGMAGAHRPQRAKTLSRSGSPHRRCPRKDRPRKPP